MKVRTFWGVLLALASVGAAQAQDSITTVDTDWRGFYVGANIGGAWNHTCTNWTPNSGISNPAIATAFYNRDCPNNGTFIGGVQKMIANLKRLNFIDGEVGGYTDSTGSAKYNQGLSERRAQAVADYITGNGIAISRLTVRGYGEDNPVADNKTPEGRAHNRRVVLHRTGCVK